MTTTITQSALNAHSSLIDEIYRTYYNPLSMTHKHNYRVELEKLAIQKVTSTLPSDVSAQVVQYFGTGCKKRHSGYIPHENEIQELVVAVHWVTMYRQYLMLQLNRIVEFAKSLPTKCVKSRPFEFYLCRKETLYSGVHSKIRQE